MTTLDTLKQSYHSAVKNLHYASLNDRASDAQMWIMVAENIARQCRECFGENPGQLIDAE